MRVQTQVTGKTTKRSSSNPDGTLHYSLQATTKHLEQAMKNWFEGRAKKPRFKAKKNKQSISFPQNVKIVGEYLKIPKVNLVKAKFTRPIEGEIKTVTISVTL